MIKIENLTYCYNKNKKLFNGLTMDMKPGKIVGLLGKNGAGKSTLMKNLAGLLFPTEGSCLVDQFHPHERKTAFLEQLFFIPEECHLPALTLPQFEALYGPFYPGFDKSQFRHFLQEFRIDYQSHLQRLSFGQKKKAFIAFGLSTNTRLLIMDEPTNGLDIPSKLQFRNIMAYTDRKDQVILISTHQVRDVDDIIHTVIIMDNNQVVLYEEKEKIRQVLQFTTSDRFEMNDQVIYSEQTPAGIVSICRHSATTANTSAMDLEILFNASLNNPELIKQLFTTAN
jgi:ABC-2 type transport system ATP-binding protein